VEPCLNNFSHCAPRICMTQVRWIEVDSNDIPYFSGSISGTVHIGGVTLVANSTTNAADGLVVKLTPSGSVTWAKVGHV
jgi:hypothetical protein